MNNIIKIGITGQNGFIGSHLSNYLALQENIELVPFHKYYFAEESALLKFVRTCDTIVHLAALNRHEDPQVIYDTNVDLVLQLILACQKTNSKPHILISSSTQESNDNLYGKSKKKGRLLLENWANESGGKVSGLIIPNVFGPFGRPNYNSVVATFCHKVAIGEEPTIIKDALIQLIYVNELVEDIYKIILEKTEGKINIPYRYEIKVSGILERLIEFKNKYLDNCEFPKMNDPFNLALFNTFRCYIPHDFYPQPLIKHKDDRGYFVEIVRADTPGQSSFSLTKPGITRGNHFHTRKAERFAVIKGKACIKLRKIGSKEIVEYIIDGDQPAFVDMPIWHTHNIKNIGKGELITLFWINEPYNSEDPDTFFIEV